MLDNHQSNFETKQPRNAVVKTDLISDACDSWTVADSAKLYNIEGWGEPYFSIDRTGNIAVSPQGIKDKAIDLLELIESLKQQGIELPLVVRFPDILADRMARLNSCMQRAIARYDYSGTYQGVFPIKCNQNRHLIEALVARDSGDRFGLEAGSKPELAIALAYSESQNRPSLLICNGYKDNRYIETALLATKLKDKPIIIIEQPQELELVLEVSQKLNIRPILGVRAKLNAKGIGRWGDSSGERAKFGLSVAEILQVVHRLKTVGKLDCLQLLHFHIGSQVSAIGVIKNAIREASQIYVQLDKLGANMQYLNVGGGLAVDYDGSKSNAPASKNYNMQNYANDITAQVKDACDGAGIAHPILISESGRAIAAHQSVLIFDVLNTSNIHCPEVESPEKDAPLVIKNFWSTYQEIDDDNLQESYHDAIGFKQEALSLFNFGYLSLSDRAKAEELYWGCCDRIVRLIEHSNDVPDELTHLPQIMAAIYYVNLSIFRSVPDTWAIDQLFPIMPIHRLDEQPTQKGVLADITCDSDGKVSRFIDRQKTKEVLELHSVDNASLPYYLGMFLVGAYQEIMGNLHNLFGDTNVVQIKTKPTGYQIESVVRGDTVEEVLSCVQYDSKNLLEMMRRRTESALQDRSITPEEAEKLLQNYTDTLESYTYLS